ncbi:uncharacterized protein LOC142239842 [Haematobia irritans]|uniref:uncharacterized protein LOC142239842 n=1 Tax=Haematobia irritans TaxID=7368 RepID=UPI003F4F8367
MLLTVLDKLLINIFTRVSRMCWYSLAARISTKLIQIIMVIILSWSNLEIGVYSYVSNDHFKDLKAEYSFSKTRSHIVQNTEPEQFKSELSSKMQKTYTVLNQQRQRVHYEQKDIIHNGVLEETYQREKYNNSITEKSEKAWNSKSEENNRMLNTSISNIENIYPTSESTHFGTENSTLVTTQIGATALLPCTVHQIGEGVELQGPNSETRQSSTIILVSWIRRKDYHLLTVGLTTYSSDERFSTSHLKHTEDWTLQIKFVQQRDAGIYECQISTHPPTSIFLYLEVVVCIGRSKG